ncbi:MAG: L-seryl-tRNA(Sec) selenium transferase [Desulfuromonadales bacterium]|mgnify:CR=1 FL=1|nr:L-seryl-tRNA(Sec) selenium transferase [Desulfuromonadales bacterium]
MPDRRALLRTLPAIDRLLGSRILSKLEETQPHLLILEAAQKVVDNLRQQLLDEQAPLPDLETEAVAELVAVRVALMAKPSLRKVINVTGTLLHTNLGRAPLCNDALQAIKEVAQGYSNLEYDLDAGQRGKRFTHVEELICKLTGGEAATVVNNNAGAVMLALAALSGGKSAIVSRGELIEIGGSFRIPDIMAASGVELVEVGTTNKTHLKDYADAIDKETALILKVHTSNYRILGFTEAVSGEELAELAHQQNIPVLEDLGSGLLIDLTPYGLPREPTVREALGTGIDLVTFSGDKLLGGPQAGIIVGNKDVIDKVRKHPMARALRSDKLSLAALEATLRLYLDPQKALQQIPTLRMLSLPVEELQRRCEKLLPQLLTHLGDQADCSIIETTATVGGGALPLAELPGCVIALAPKQISLNELTTRLRSCETAVVGRIQDDRFLIDPRTLNQEDEDLLLKALKQIFCR